MATQCWRSLRFAGGDPLVDHVVNEEEHAAVETILKVPVMCACLPTFPSIAEN